MDGMAGRVMVWLNPDQAELAGEVARVAGFEIVGAGGPREGRSGSGAAALGVPHVDDLRSALGAAEADLIWLAAPGDFGTDQTGDDARALLGAKGRGVKVVTLEPIPATALDLAAGGWTAASSGVRAVDTLRFCPLARLAPAFRQAAETLQSFGHVRALSVEAWCSTKEGSLGARLFGAMELVHALMGEPETIDAAYVSPAHGQGIHALPGETLRNLHGDMTANVRFADGRIAAIAISDQAGRWNRTATLLGPGGRLRLFDDGFEWVSPGGEKLDEARPKRPARGKRPEISPAVAMMADAIGRLLDPAIPDPGPADHETILAMSQAGLLSARTGQGESPATIRRMAGG
jgi:hypothetical protein